MHPILFRIPLGFIPGLPDHITIHTYGALVALAFLLGMWWGGYDARRRGENPALIMDLVFWVIVSGLVGSRIFYLIVVDPGVFVRAPLEVFKIWQGGVAYYGGVLGALAAVVYYCWRYRISFWTAGDIICPGLSIGHAVGRLGCLMAGCCHGRPAPLGAWYGIVFPADPDSLAPAGVLLYPTQLMESFGEVLIFLFLVWRGRHQKYSGQVFLSYMIIYALLRAGLEYFRGDTDRGYLLDPWISTSQGVALGMVVVCLGLAYWRRRRVA